MEIEIDRNGNGYLMRQSKSNLLWSQKKSPVNFMEASATSYVILTNLRFNESNKIDMHFDLRPRRG